MLVSNSSSVDCSSIIIETCIPVSSGDIGGVGEL